MTFELGVYSFGNTPRTADGSLGDTAQAIRDELEAVHGAKRSAWTSSGSASTTRGVQLTMTFPQAAASPSRGYPARTCRTSTEASPAIPSCQRHQIRY
jgi:hypothetical protein